MPTATSTINPSLRARNFALRFAAWSLSVFALLRLSWVEAHVVLPLTLLQGRLAERCFGASAQPVEVTLACSGADAIALSIAAIFAYPARWSQRLAGAGAGVALILALNVVRIGTLARAAASPAWFNILHVYLWPVALMLAIAAYAFLWMRVADGRDVNPAVSWRRTPVHRFVWTTALLLVVFALASPMYLASASVLAVAAFIARAAAGLLHVAGVRADVSGGVLTTARGAFQVTQECIVTPLIPVYAAAIATVPMPWQRRALWLVAALPIFVALGIARVLVVALPPTLVASPFFLVHAFFQLLMAVVIVTLAAVWRHGAVPTAWRRSAAGLAAGAVLIALVDPRLAPALRATAGAIPDPQGALIWLPAFQLGLYLALSVAVFDARRWWPLAAGCVLLLISQVAFVFAMQAAWQHWGATLPVTAVRAWSLIGPVAVIALVESYARRRG